MVLLNIERYKSSFLASIGKCHILRCFNGHITSCRGPQSCVNFDRSGRRIRDVSIQMFHHLAKIVLKELIP